MITFYFSSHPTNRNAKCRTGISFLLFPAQRTLFLHKTKLLVLCLTSILLLMQGEAKCQTVNLTAIEDTWLRQSYPTRNYGGSTTIQVSPNSDFRQNSLFRWDLSGIPADATVMSASLTFFVTDGSAYDFSLFNLKRSWVEGTSNDDASSTSSNWNTYNGTDSWASGGAMNTASDRFDTDLWDATAATFSSTGSVTIPLNTSGIAVIQNWIDIPSGNYGLTVQYTGTGTTADYWKLSSSEATTEANRPKLTITYTLSPIITITGALSEFTSQPGMPSAEQSYSVSGINLTDDIIITPPPDFEISLSSGNGFGTSPIVLPPSEGVVTPAIVYVRFLSDTEGTASGAITHTSIGAADKLVEVAGIAEAGWTAFNDGVFIEGQISTNITTYPCYTNNATGLLNKYTDGSNTDVNVLVITSGTVESQITGDYWGSETNAGTDAYETFHTYVNMVGGTRLGSASSYIDLVFTGLDPSRSYSFATTANRNNPAYTARITRFTLSDVSTAANASSTGVTVNNNLSVSFSTGYNTVNGFIAQWTSIQSGTDGDFKVRFEVNSDNYAYGPSVFMLKDDTSGGEPVNQAPDQPVLLEPANGATGVSTNPTLEIIVSDPNEDNLTVTFYGRPSGTTVPGDDFTLIAIPDSQNESSYFPAAFLSQTQWMADNKTSGNIAFVTHLGDIVNSSSNTIEWNNADAAMDLLDPANVFYSVGPGNHDLGGLYETYFGVSRFSGKSWYRGHFGSDNYNNYSFFSASGMDFLVINLQYSPTTAMLDWADALLKANTTRRGIVVSHSILNLNNTFTSEGTTIFNALKDNANLFLMLCGHMNSSTDGAAYLAQSGDDGHTIHLMLADYQLFPSGGNGYLRLLRFSPADNKIYATTYSPYADVSITTSPDQMEMAYTMQGVTPDFAIIGTSNIASGGKASIAWSDQELSTGYEWYVTVSDGTQTITSPNWSFTTQCSNLWTGNMNSNWNELGNWSCEIPTPYSDVIIPATANNPIISSAVSIKSLVINSNAIVTVNPNFSLTVSHTITNLAGNDGLLIKSNTHGTGSLIHHNDDVPATIQRHITGSTDLGIFKYHFISIPLKDEGQLTSNLFHGSYLFDFDESTNQWSSLGASATTGLASNKGYMVYYPSDSVNYSFSGIMNSGTFTIPVTHAGNGYNLVPNPYPSAIDWDAPLGWSRTGIENAIYIWPAETGTSGNYAIYVAGGEGTNGGSRNIAQGQSFFVHATTSSTLTMDNNVRLHNPVSFLKAEEIIPDLLRIKVVVNNSSDEILVHLTEAATAAYDGDRDAFKLEGGADAPQLSSVLADNTKLSINCLPFDSDLITIPLNFSFNASATISLTAAGMETFTKNLPIYLEDGLTGSIINLRNNPVYTFSYEPGSDESRFKLHFAKVVGIGGGQEPTEGTAYISGGELFVDVPSMKGQKTEIKVYNMLGQQLDLNRVTMNGLINMPFSLPTGVYIVRVTSATQVFASKLVNN